MFSHDDCLNIVRKKFPNRAVVMSHKAGERYFFRLSYGAKIEPENYTRVFQEIAVDAKTGKAEPFDVFGYTFQLDEKEADAFDKEFLATRKFIDAEPKTEYELARM